MLDVIRMWQCSACDELHDKEWDAEECCQPEVFAVFVCPVCRDTHDTEAAALECCDSTADEATQPDYHVPPRVLEEHGQVRLF